MTGLNVILHREAAHVITDGAVFGENVMRWQTAKAFPLPHLRAVVAVTGRPAHVPIMATILGMCADTFDAMKLHAVRAVREAEAHYAPLLAQASDRHFAVMVAGLANDGEPEAFVVTNDARLATPYEVQQLGAVAMIPADPAAHERFRETFPGLDSGDDLDPERDGLRMLDLQRERTDWGIGAFAQLTTVTAAGISMRVIHRWDRTADLGVTVV